MQEYGGSTCPEEGNTFNLSVEDEVRTLRSSLEVLRAEVDMKMHIMEQILSTRSEQFLVQKRLIEREHALYESVMTHWRSTAELAANGQSIRYSKSAQDFHVVENQRMDSSTSISAKRSSTYAAFASDTERTRLRAKRFRASSYGSSFGGKTETVMPEQPSVETHWQVDDDTNDDTLGSTDDLLDTEVEANPDSGGDSDDGEYDADAIGSGMEKRVFVNFYSADPSTNPEEGSSDPVWIHFLHEEKGTTALCKHCDEKGFQKIYKLRTPSMGVLRKHLKRTHKIIIETPRLPVPEKIETPEAEKGRRRIMPFLRHNDHLYTRYTHRNFVEYWRCREKTCSGKIVRRNGTIQCTGEHNCLTTAQDCDAIIFREKIRELAETEPTLPPADVIAAAKVGIPEDVLELVPNDDSLRRTIRRIRQALESAAATTSPDWT